MTGRSKQQTVGSVQKSKTQTPSLLRIRVAPKSRREAVTVGKKGTLEVSVKEPAEDNRANSRAVELVAAHLGVPVKALRIIRGHHSQGKILEVYAHKL
ncbi:MAG: DUF167 domain-containing protein [Patescibacteria group bacterium]